jgi:predicted glycoside hydrolase/deacetylase ChbG (UPF0249 family)
MISLIVNADDLGSNPGRDRGILEAYSKGIVSSVSLLANGPSFISAAAHVSQHKVPTGVHLNLADGTTLSGEIKGLTGPDGELPEKNRLRECLEAGNCDQQAIRRELAAQIERIIDHGITPDHIDSHQHCQIFPCISQMIVDLSIEFGIKAMRTACPAEPVEEDPKGDLGKEITLYRRFARNAQDAIHKANICTPDGLWGMPLLNCLDETRLCQLLDNLPEGHWELMTHPGYTSNTGNPFDSKQREIELHALTSKKALDIIRQRNIRLCNFGDLPCAS